MTPIRYWKLWCWLGLHEWSLRMWNKDRYMVRICRCCRKRQHLVSWGTAGRDKWETITDPDLLREVKL